jgi:hypothetical protein
MFLKINKKNSLEIQFLFCYKAKKKRKREFELLRKRHQESRLRKDPEIPEEERKSLEPQH